MQAGKHRLKTVNKTLGYRECASDDPAARTKSHFYARIAKSSVVPIQPQKFIGWELLEKSLGLVGST